jgi:hypothetical protein
MVCSFAALPMGGTGDRYFLIKKEDAGASMNTVEFYIGGQWWSNTDPNLITVDGLDICFDNSIVLCYTPDIKR